MSLLPRPKAILFDWDNTLVNTWPMIHEALVHTFNEMGVEPWPIEVTMKRVRKSMRDSFPELFGENWEKAGELYQNYYRANHLERLEVIAGAQEVLEAIKREGIFCAVVSNKKARSLHKEVPHLGWQGYFNAVVGSDDAARDKPFADPVLKALEGSGIESGADVWFVGDSDIDLECAKNTGCTPVLYGEIAATHEGYVAGKSYGGFDFSAYVADHPAFAQLLSSSLARAA